MRWKQFFTPVTSIDTTQARSMMDEKPGQEMTILDVRQPNEYEAGHLPGRIVGCRGDDRGCVEVEQDLHRREHEEKEHEKSGARADHA